MSELSDRQRRNVELAENAFDAYNAGDVDYLLGSFDAELELYAAPELMNAGTFHGHPGFIDWVTQWNEAWDGFRTEPLRIDPVGDEHMIIDVHQTGRGAGSGIPVEMDVFWAFETIDERTTRAHIYSRRVQAAETVARWRAERGDG